MDTIKLSSYHQKKRQRFKPHSLEKLMFRLFGAVKCLRNVNVS